MPETNGGTELRIRGYLANHGGSVEDGGGRGLTDDMARELGVDKPASLSAVLLEMERDGVITREMRGLRTYKIALVNGDNPGVAPASHRVSLRESHASESAAGVAPSAGDARSGDTVVSLREALARKAAADPPPEPEAEVEPATGEPATAVVSLRDALARPAGKAVTRPVPARVAPPVPADDEWRRPPAPAAVPATSGGRALSLRDAIAAGVDTAPPPASWPEEDSPPDWQTSSGGQFTSLRDTARLAPLPDSDRDDDAGARGRGPGKSKGPGRPARTRPLLSVPVPDVKAPPSNSIITAVGVALAGLVLVAVITTVFLRGTTHQVVSEGSSSVDSCNVVTPALATEAFGDDAGSPNYVLGTCVYDDGTHELIVEVYRQDAQGLFNAANSASAQAVPNLGNSAFYDNGELRVLQGSSMLEITLGPVPAATPAPSLLAAARLAIVRLTLPVVTG